MDAYLDQFAEDRINGGYGSILDQIEADERFGDDEPVCLTCEDFGCSHCVVIEDDEPNDHILSQQELEDFEQADEYFWHFGDDTGDW
ncbi:hypothetical protein ETAA8_08970 [Anatilimnocola aggregata]|uniref:Uncharacterized protein n=1 Tax=Anatilimnocola aggregata TaxID=2528021 RepID=A0A517Y6G9_9BACT|nr:hypothetical protein [Anatilimnocola aggregata]QDU25825.1 hypothetical protein ETAA8_08970 [Anatilimnocola aggregata]